MKETAEMLMKHTRSELVEMAEKLGINIAGVAKMNIADSIVKARKTAEKPAAKEASKQRTEASKTEVPRKAQFKSHIGKKGVFAKRDAISAQMGVNAEAVAAIGTGVMEMQTSIKDMTFGMNKFAKKIQQEGSAKLHKGVDEMQKSINAQIKSNEKAAAKMGTGIKEMHKGVQELRSAFDDKTHEFQICIKEMHSGVKEIQTGIHEMEARFGEFQNETANYIKDFYYG
jgi:post-segregation antitoxin (ccd killing protein)